jgi:dipeptidyl aminopeptidase/acylaminoacyl peptidase
MRSTNIAAAACLVVFFAGAVAGQDIPARKRPLTAEDLWKVKRPGAPAVSPDGKWVAVEVTSYNIENDERTSDIWLLATDGKTQKRLTDKGTNSDPAWSPDGKTIAFVGKRAPSPPAPLPQGERGATGQAPLPRGERGESAAQIHLVSVSGGKIEQLSHMPIAPSGLKWGPDGKTIYCIAWTWPNTPDDTAYQQKAKAFAERKSKAFIIDDGLYRVWNHWIADGKRPVVFAVDVVGGAHKNLFAGTKLHLPVPGPPDELSPAHYDISPDGKELCFTADSVKELGTDYNMDLYVMPLDKPGPPRNITEDNPAADAYPAYSPDGRSIAFTRQTIKFFYADRQRLMLYDRQSGQRREITAKFDRSCGPPKWASDSRRIVFQAQDKGHVRLFSVAPENGVVTPLTSGHTDQSPSLSRQGATVAFLRSTFGRPLAVHVLPASEAPPRKLDAFNDELAATWDLGEVKEVYIKGAGGEDVQMWIVYPPGFDSKKKWPLLQVVHGGPHGAMLNDFNFRYNLHLFAAKGYVVASVNFHGSSSFGQAFTDSITGDMGTKPLADVLAGTDSMAALPYIDQKRLAAFGASYGGYMMAWLNGHTDRFAALVCHAGVYNWHSMAASDYVRNFTRPLGAEPWGDPSAIDKHSPQRFAKNFKTPTLVTHGELDFRVPVTQGLEYYNTLRLKGVPTRLVYFPDEDHSILKPQNSLLWHREVFAWLDKHAGHGPR